MADCAPTPMECAGQVATDKESLKAKLEASIGQVRFIDTEMKIQHYRCRHCQLVAVNHFRNRDCEHVLCRECFQNESRNGCPVCRGSVASMYQDPVFEEELLKLKVHCAYKNMWCDEIVPLQDYLDHKYHCRPQQGSPSPSELASAQRSADDLHKKLSNYLHLMERCQDDLREKLRVERDAKRRLEDRVQDLEERLQKECDAKQHLQNLLLQQIREDQERQIRFDLERKLRTPQDF